MSGITSIQSSQIFIQSANHTFNVNTGNNVKAEAASKDKEDGVTMSKDGDTVQISAQGTAVSGSSSSSLSTNNLSQYTATELKEMLQNGEITQSEYNAEIESRSSSSDNSDSEEALGTVTIKEQND